MDLFNKEKIKRGQSADEEERNFFLTQLKWLKAISSIIWSV